jgi:hypothetical protein
MRHRLFSVTGNGWVPVYAHKNRVDHPHRGVTTTVSPATIFAEIPALRH